MQEHPSTTHGPSFRLVAAARLTDAHLCIGDGLSSTTNPACRACRACLLQCNIIIDESWIQSTGGITQMDGQNPPGFLQTHGIKPYANQIGAITSKQVYTLAKTTGMPVTNTGSPNLGYIGLDWFERGVSRADWVSSGWC